MIEMQLTRSDLEHYLEMLDRIEDPEDSLMAIELCFDDSVTIKFVEG